MLKQFFQWLSLLVCVLGLAILSGNAFAGKKLNSSCKHDDQCASNHCAGAKGAKTCRPKGESSPGQQGTCMAVGEVGGAATTGQASNPCRK